MDYFIELLDSYSRLKKRTLRILVENEDAQVDPGRLQKATSEVISKVGTNGENAGIAWSGPTGSQIKTGKPSESKAKQGIIAQIYAGNYAISLTKDGLTANSPKLLNQAITMILGDSDGSASQPKKEKAAPGEQMATSELGESEDITQVINNFLEISTYLEPIYESLPKKYKDSISFNNWANYAYGRRLGSLESQLLNTKIRIENIGKGEYATSLTEVDAEIALAISEKFKILFRALKEDNPSSNDIRDVAQHFRRNSNGSISVITDSDDSGYVFKDVSGFLDTLLKTYEKKTGQKIANIRLAKSNDDTALNTVIRGTVLEKTRGIFNLFRVLSETPRKESSKIRVLEKLLKIKYKELEGNLKKLSVSYQAWVTAFDESALAPEEVSVINAASAILKQNKNFITSLFKMSKDVSMAKKPTWVVSTGTTTGAGKRQDTTELYADPQNAIKALLLDGFSEEEITSLGLIQNGSIDDIITDPEDYKVATNPSIGALLKKQVVSFVDVSLKHYRKLKKIVAGTATVSSHYDTIMGKSKLDSDGKFIQKFRTTANISDSDFAGLQRFAKELYDIGGHIRALNMDGFKAKNSSTGKTSKVNPLDDFVNATWNEIIHTSTYDQLYDPINGDAEKQDLMKVLNSYKNDPDPPKEVAEKAKQYLATFLKNKKLIDGIKSGDKNAINYMASKLYMSAGSVNDGLVVDARGIEAKQRVVFLQNEVINDITKSMTAGDGKWTINSNGNVTKFVLTSNPDVSVTMHDQIRPRKTAAGETIWSTDISTSFNEGLMKHYDRLSKKSKAVSEKKLEVDQAMQLFNEAFNKLAKIILAEKETIKLL